MSRDSIIDEAAEKTDKQPKTYTLDVTVEDENGDPIDNPVVTVDGETEFGDVESGTHTITAEADGFQTASRQVQVDEEDTHVTIPLSPETYTLDVTVEDENRDSIDDATVTVDGNEDFGELETGEHTVAAEAEDYERSTKEINIDGGDESIALQLESESEERERLTQRVPADLLEDVERVQEKFHLPSRNAAVNFMLNAAADDVLDDRDE